MHVADERYVIVWKESAGTSVDNAYSRLYAMQLDLASDDRQLVASRIVPPPDPQRAAPCPRTALGLVPCSH